MRTRARPRMEIPSPKLDKTSLKEMNDYP